MNEQFLEKLLKMYTKLSNFYAKELKIEKFLIHSYYKIDSDIYIYDYIDFNFIYCKLKAGYKHFDAKTINNFIETEFNLYATELKCLYAVYRELLSDLKSISAEHNVRQLNEIYYKTFK